MHTTYLKGKIMPEPKRCPICDGWIPNNDKPGAYPGALSRKDNKTEICSECGLMEAMGTSTGNVLAELVEILGIKKGGY